MRSLKLDDNGDIIFDSLGKIDMVKDLDLLAQSFQLKFKTNLGELYYNEDYGWSKLKGKITEDTLLDALNNTFLQDEKVNEIQIADFTYTSVGQISANILFILNTDEIINLNFII